MIKSTQVFLLSCQELGEKKNKYKNIASRQLASVKQNKKGKNDTLWFSYSSHFQS